MATAFADTGAVEEVQETAPRDFETEAREGGWRPLEEFKGNPDLFIDAETYVKRGEELTPFIKKQLRVVTRELETVKKDFAKYRDFATKAEDRAYDRALSDLEAKLEAATEIGDVAATKAVAKEIKELGNAPVEAPAIDPEVNAALESFMDANPWYKQAGEAKDYAEFIATGKYAPLSQTMKPAEFFEFIAEKTKAVFPDLDGTPAPRAKPRSAVEAPTNRTTQRSAHNYANLPNDARQMCDSMAKKGYLPGATIDEQRAYYAKNFDWS